MSGIGDTRAPGRRTSRAFMGRLASGPNLLGVLGRRVGRAFVGRLASEPNPFEALGSSRLTRGAEPEPKVPTAITLFYVSPSYHSVRCYSMLRAVCTALISYVWIPIPHSYYKCSALKTLYIYFFSHLFANIF